MLQIGAAQAQTASPGPNLKLGDLVVTGFSGTVAPDPAKLAGKSAADLTFVNPDGPSARIMDIQRASETWDARDLPAAKPFDVLARDVGQVFGIALDDQTPPDIYLSATSAFGLQLVGRGPDGRPLRVKRGGPGEGWMRGQFGLELQGGPGSIFKVDGNTGVVSLFADVALDGVPNPAPALGSLAFDAAHQQLFVSDLYTGMIHRFDLNGDDLGHFDHGVAGRAAAQVAPVPFDPSARPNIAVAKFDSQNPDTWGYAPLGRRVWGLAVHEGRLFYSVAEGPQVWSVGIRNDGGFADDPRWELDVPAQPGPYQVSDILFSHKGAMILAQRAPIVASYDFKAFTAPAEPRVLRYWLESPKKPENRSRWIAEPEEYAVGFADDYRNTNGGVALGYGYGPDGALDTKSCEAALWTTGQDLRDDPALQEQLLPGGPLVVHGVQALPAAPVRPFNQPPWTSFSVDYDSAFHDPAATGHLGQVRILTAPCAEGQYGGPGFVASAAAPAAGGGNTGGGNTGGGGNCPNGTNPDGSCVIIYDLAIAKTGVAAATAGGFTFTLAVTNPGAAIVNTAAIEVTDVVPAGVTFTGVAAGSDWNCTPAPPIAAGGTLTCAYVGAGPIASGAALPPIAITATAPLGGSFKNCSTVGFTAASGLQDSNPSNNTSCATVTNPIDLGIVKSGGPAGDGGATGGASGLEFDLTVTNVGLGFAGANNVTVTDVVPAGMTYTFLSATPAGAWSCPTTPVAAGASFICTYIGAGPVGPGAFMGTIAISATPPPPQGQTATNCATVGVTPASGLQDSNPSNNTACVTLNSLGNVPVSTPPALPTTCGFNTIFVVDKSTSMTPYVADVTAALTNAASVFNQGGSQAAEILFSDAAQLKYSMSASTYPNLPGSYPVPFGETNWEAALQMATTIAAPPPTVVIFITDGAPDKYLDSSGNVVYTNNTAIAANAAVPFVNQLYAAGIPIIGIGLTGASSEPATLANMTALLGPANVTMTPYAGLPTALSGIAHALCPGLYLAKSISPDYFNYNGLTAAPQANVTLTLTNSNAGAPLTQVVAHDDLQPQLTLPSSFTSSETPTSPPPTFVPPPGPGPTLPGSGGELVWTIDNLPAGAVTSVTFPVTLPLPGSKYAPAPGSCVTINNYAQVFAAPPGSDGAAKPDNMPSPINGLNIQVDEATAPLYLCNSQPPPPEYCVQAELLVTKVYDGATEACTPGSACPFKVTVTPVCTKTSPTGPGISGFNGPVEFGEGVYSVAAPTSTPSSGALVAATGLTISSSISGPGSMTSCATNSSWTPATSTASACPAANVTLAFGSTITFPVTINAPASASYPAVFLNCFIADGTSASPPTTYAGAFNDANNADNPLQTLQSVPQAWGNCAPFEVDVTAQRVRPVCAPPTIPGPTPGSCVCPQGQQLQDKKCVVVHKLCPPPMIPGPTPGSCVCPEGMQLQGKECVPIRRQCPPPMIPGPTLGSCVCPQGMQLQGKECVPIRKRCAPPTIPGPRPDSCVCPPGMQTQGKACIPIAKRCTPPMIAGPTGKDCVCPAGTVQKNGRCAESFQPRKGHGAMQFFPGALRQ